jgi:endonuclease/exonuclease/phosphatase family metal-dependent hydrolase
MPEPQQPKSSFRIGTLTPVKPKESFKVATLNLWGGQRLDSAIKILREEKPNVLMLQEVRKDPFMLRNIRQALDMQSMVFAPMGSYCGPEKMGQALTGVAILADKELSEDKIHPLGEFNHDPKTAGRFWPEYNDRPLNSVLLTALYPLKDGLVRVATTHGAWVPKADSGEVSVMQKLQTAMMKEYFLTYPDHPIVFGADFNRQVNTAAFCELSPLLRSVLPASVRSTIDPVHIANKEGFTLELAVDTICISESLVASDVRVVSGLSDHCMVVATISRR